MGQAPDPHERHRAQREALRAAVLDGPAAADPSLRQAAAGGGLEALPDSLREYVANVREASYRITDEHLEALRQAGHSEDEIFDVTVAAALGRALEGFDAGLRAMGPD